MAVKRLSGEVSVRVGKLADHLDAATRIELQERLAVYAIGLIRRRTQKGTDADGQRFASYSTAYAALREKSGRRTDPPDLWLTGQLLGSMQVLRSGPDGAVIGFAGTHLNGKFKKARRAVPHRKVPGKLVTHRVSTSGKKSMPNAVLALYVMTGKKPRRFFGLSMQDRAALVREAVRVLRIK